MTDHLGYWLRLVSNNVSTAFARRLEAEEVTVAEWVVLRALFDVDELAPSKLATVMSMTRGAISKLSDRLLAKRLIERSDSLDDGRAHTLRLSVKGRALVPRLARLADANDASFFGVLSSEEQAALRRALEKIAKRHGLNETPVD
ncbi:MarR family transcriptional regulator [Hyphomicrobium sp. D-2]|nr:MarR family transcriptional regulator [Hyphomicrobium sp. D-2]MDH4982321.1 MarR family transcriptional regulator [Hyphomicrobium sp. D-2]